MSPSPLPGARNSFNHLGRGSPLRFWAGSAGTRQLIQIRYLPSGVSLGDSFACRGINLRSEIDRLNPFAIGLLVREVKIVIA